MKFYPSIIAKNQKEFEQRYKKIEELGKNIHLDVMDGRFVRNRSMQFGLKFNKGKNYSAHLMMNNSLSWLKRNLRRLSGAILHFESQDLDKSIDFIKLNKKKVGIAIKPSTKVSEIKDYIPKIDYVVVMTVNPGKYGSDFLSENLKKIREIKAIKRIEVIVDGSVNDKTIKRVKKAGADSVVLGSYLQNSRNPKKSLKILKDLIK